MRKKIFVMRGKRKRNTNPTKRVRITRKSVKIIPKKGNTKKSMMKLLMRMIIPKKTMPMTIVNRMIIPKKRQRKRTIPKTIMPKRKTIPKILIMRKKYLIRRKRSVSVTAPDMPKTIKVTENVKRKSYGSYRLFFSSFCLPLWEPQPYMSTVLYTGLHTLKPV